MLGVVGHLDGLIDQQHGNAVLDAVGTPQSRVVEELIVDEKQWPAILRAHEDAQQFLV